MREHIDLTRIHAVIFDTDGVVTDSARVHAAAWKRVFDEFLRGLDRPFVPFDIREDYLRHVDGRERHDGVREFLRSRGIDLPEGSPDDPPGSPTVHGLGAAKDGYFLQQVRRYGVAAFPQTIRLVCELRHRGARTGVVSASRHCAEILSCAGVAHLFDTRVDGVEAARLRLPGKPDPALFLEAARRLAVPPDHAAIVEDAAPGVEAGSRGGFALVIGIAPEETAEALRARGAHIVVPTLDDLPVTGRTPVHAP
ncbi:HAD family hydrolase [Bailinhaonella thermotolerans]|uniref:HAD family hydrolase n=1 Tax=Bailinhaonella thermotolerans TaxID=1070861 RepID=A0A3A4AWQ1_9ACTN|nr:HAD-IA family hydrolase [Bailinhaonella thermotolerans]RJL31804.1 HAD family hydrolase [Bailinhaonella thermotolerans]